ncbi:Phenazine biosynthesis protein PhzF like type [Rubellimicrobium mesophilum DSM 19309]|uniref:Phenazine biosynthesis protein PhzF like type n=1 Tax=Rubellimicrobium mesophilum DSM 19309 TaxID=442562 RepID=A0A017HIY2_9RHOB|nr:PhzF family phenazine biosynthesis protein [Rubellimicrobium mesophilum]EYD74078.1 Phenazine biosynthesis protein PhzF like type [Rubellimicrobium mesophilum DSM 19309]
MRPYSFETADVFTSKQFGGNPLAVITDARGLSTRHMQSIAAEFNFSETTFVLLPEDPANTARVRIFNRTAEMPFAGHPSIGTGYVLAGLGRGRNGPLHLEVPAGLVRVEIERDAEGRPTGGKITAPQPLSVGGELPVEGIASCLGLNPDDVDTSEHAPCLVSVGVPFVVARLRPDALGRCSPDLSAFRGLAAAHPWLEGRLSLHVYCKFEAGLRARMFAPLAGTFEDPATGSANAPLGALLLSLGTEPHAEFEVRQGEEMGRPSVLHVTAERRPSGLHATVAGRCVTVSRGELLLSV